MICEVKSIGPEERVLWRRRLSSSLSEILGAQGFRYDIWVKGNWNVWRKEGKLRDEPRFLLAVARRILDTEIGKPGSTAVVPLDPPHGEITLLINGERPTGVPFVELVNRVVLDPIGLSKRMRSGIKKSLTQFKKSNLGDWPFFAVLYVRDFWAEYDEFEMAIRGDIEVTFWPHLKKTYAGRRGRVFSPELNKSLTGVMFVPKSVRLKPGVDRVLYWNPFSRWSGQREWFAHPGVEHVELLRSGGRLVATTSANRDRGNQ